MMPVNKLQYIPHNMETADNGFSIDKNGILSIDSTKTDKIIIYGINGELLKEIANPNNSVDLSYLKNNTIIICIIRDNKIVYSRMIKI